MTVPLNSFHWHITDRSVAWPKPAGSLAIALMLAGKQSQAWPLVIPSHPELSERAAYSQSQIYSLETVKEVIGYANAIGIEVMLEIDT
jgi:hexosaminidase